VKFHKNPTSLAVSLLNVMGGLWLAGFYILIFWRLAQGGFIFESNEIVIKAELCLAIVVTCWYLWQLPLLIIKFSQSIARNIEKAE